MHKLRAAENKLMRIHNSCRNRKQHSQVKANLCTHKNLAETESNTYRWEKPPAQTQFLLKTKATFTSLHKRIKWNKIQAIALGGWIPAKEALSIAKHSPTHPSQVNIDFENKIFNNKFLLSSWKQKRWSTDHSLVLLIHHSKKKLHHRKENFPKWRKAVRTVSRT
jgi:hypothetical protein